MKSAACLLAVAATMALVHPSLPAQTSPTSSIVATTSHRIAPVERSPAIILSGNGGSIYFTTPADTIPDNSKGARRSIGIRYAGTIGVQGVQFTVKIPGTDVRLRGIEPGADLPSPEGWSIDYQVHNAKSGSEVTVLAFGRDTTIAIPAGDHHDCFRIVLDVADLKLCDGAPGGDLVAETLSLGGVASSLANRYGYSAGLALSPADSAMHLAIFDAASRGDVECSGGLDLAGILRMADAVSGGESLEKWQFNRADLAPWSQSLKSGAFLDDAIDYGDGTLDESDLTLIVRALLRREWPDGTPVAEPDAAAATETIPPAAADAALTCSVTADGLSVSLRNDREVKGIEMTIRAGDIPEGAIALPTERIAAGFRIEKVMKDGDLRMIIYSPAGRMISSGNGPLLTIPFPAGRGARTIEMTAAAAGADNRKMALETEAVNGIAAVEPDRPNGPFALAGAPNPFSGSTTIRYNVETRRAVTMTLCDPLGHEVARPLDGAIVERGAHTLPIDGTLLPPGTYLCTISAGGRTSTARLILVR